MTVKKLKEELAKHPDNLEVFVAERKTEFRFGLVNSVRSEEIAFAENPDFKDGKELAKDTVVVIDED